MFEKLKDYISSRVLLLKIEGAERLSNCLSVLFRNIVLVLILFCFLFFVSIAFALWIGEIYNSIITGFVITSGIYLLIFIIFLIFKKQLLERNIKDEIVRNFFKD